MVSMIGPKSFFKDYTSTCEDHEVPISLTLQEPESESLLEDNNIVDCIPYKGQIFNNIDDSYHCYRSFAKKNRFSIRREHLYKCNKKKSEENLSGIYKRELVCHRGGLPKQTNTEMQKQRKRKSSRCNCGAKMLIIRRTIGFEEKWVVMYFSNHHNHELLDGKEVQLLPAYRHIPIIDQNRIMLLSKAGCLVSLILRVLELEKGISAGNLPFLEKDIRNFIQSQSRIGKEKDAFEEIFEVATEELEKVIQLVKKMPEYQEHTTHSEHIVSNDGVMLKIQLFLRQKVDQDQKEELKLQQSLVIAISPIMVELIMTQEIVEEKRKKLKCYLLNLLLIKVDKRLEKAFLRAEVLNSSNQDVSIF